MGSNAKKRKFHIHVLSRPTEYTQIYNLAHYERRLSIPDLIRSEFDKTCKTGSQKSDKCKRFWLHDL